MAPPGLIPGRFSGPRSLADAGRLRKTYRSRGLDLLLPGDRGQRLRADTLGLGRDAQEVRRVRAVTADPLVLAGSAGQRVRAVNGGLEQAGLRVEALRSGAVAVLDLHRAAWEDEGGGGTVALGVSAWRGEDAVCDERES